MSRKTINFDLCQKPFESDTNGVIVKRSKNTSDPLSFSATDFLQKQTSFLFQKGKITFFTRCEMLWEPSPYFFFYFDIKSAQLEYLYTFKAQFCFVQNFPRTKDFMTQKKNSTSEQSRFHFPNQPQSRFHFPNQPQSRFHFPNQPQSRFHFPQGNAHL